MDWVTVGCWVAVLDGCRASLLWAFSELDFSVVGVVMSDLR